MRCKPGQLAIIIKAKRPENVGRVVEILHPLGERPHYAGRFWYGGAGFCWEVRAVGAPMRSVQGSRMTDAPCPDTYMRPITPSDAPALATTPRVAYTDD